MASLSQSDSRTPQRDATKPESKNVFGRNVKTAPLSLPAELQDDQQAAVLYSPFRDKSLNPRSWTRKMEFWQKLLVETAMERKIMTFDANALPIAFQRKGMTPKCLTTVTEELLRLGKIKKLDAFNKSQGWLSWGFNSLVKQPLSWSVTRLWGSSKNSVMPDVYVWPDVVQKVCDEVLAAHHNRIRHQVTDCVTTLADFREKSSTTVSNDQEFNIVLNQLERTEKIRLKESDDGTLMVKFCKPDEQIAQSFQTTDLQISRISLTQKKLEEEVETLSSRIDGFKEEARMNLKLGKKTLALHSLRKKKATQKVLDRKSNSILMLEDIINKIEEARTNEMVVSACETGVAALKAMTSVLDLDKVEAVMDGVQEAVENQEEISNALSTPSTDHLSDLDTDLDQELEDLLAGDIASTSVDDRVSTCAGAKFSTTADDSLELQFSSLMVDDLGLPDVPSHSPRLEPSPRLPDVPNHSPTLESSPVSSKSRACQRIPDVS